MPFAPVNGIKLYYEAYGKGKPLVFLSGFSTHHLTWQSFIEPLQDDFQLILLDNRGAGQTTAPASPYSIDTMADDTVALMDHLKLDRASMVGSSMGTAIIQTIAHRAPKRIDKGVLIAPFSKLPRTSLLKIMTTGKLLQAGVPLDLVIETVIPWLFSRDFVASPEKVSAKKEEMTKNPFPQSIEGFLGQMRALETFDSSQFIRQLEAKFLLIAGEEDLSTPFSCAQFLHEHLANSTLHSFSRMGHMVHAEKHGEVLALIQKFVKM
ncbi:alpha/beta fold hydrolase [Candidatus Neptunichlamydia sp. REUL1]|uniref:alpha/beta fold hydrolase n=1 Tax=Candidatus Neptunichlamydia sp. REUL1 TaxID=3064277 RepID=UPI00292D1FF2|nr:alpha/beta hydrolase [Candidatus Neptunochlamydia sp. REUL1]